MTIDINIDNSFIYICRLVSIPIFLLSVIMAPFINKQYCNFVKPKILPEILSFIGCIKRIKADKRIKKYIASLPIVKYSFLMEIKCDDCFKGQYKGLSFDVAEFTLKDNELLSLITRRETMFFHGMLIKINLDERYTEEEIVKLLYRIDFHAIRRKILEDFRNVNMDYKTNNNAVIQKQRKHMLEKLAGSIKISFENNCINILISTDDDRFEMDIAQNVTNISNYKNIIEELMDVLAIVDRVCAEIKNGEEK